MALIVGRDACLILVSFYVRYITLEKPVTFWKYINLFEYSRIRVSAHWLSKINTAIQLTLIVVTMPSRLLDFQDSWPLFALQCLTGLTTALTSFIYIVNRGSYEVVK